MSVEEGREFKTVKLNIEIIYHQFPSDWEKRIVNISLDGKLISLDDLRATVLKFQPPL